jgi:hypothetical protein
MVAEPTGKYGVGLKSVFTKDGSNVLMYYPTDKYLFEAAIKVPENRAPQSPFGEKYKNAFPEWENQLLGTTFGVFHGFDGLTVPAWKDAKFDAGLD